MAMAVHRPPDDATFTALLQQAMPALRRFLLRLTGSLADADDLLQETLAKAWRLRASFDPTGNAAAWLQQAAFHCFCDQRRRSTAQPAGDAASWPATPTPCPVELRDEVRARLQHLEPLPRALLLGFHAEGLSLQELAARHGLPVNTVKSHLHRARHKLATEQP